MTDDLPRGFSDLVGLEFTEVDPEYSRGELEATDELRNPYGVLHGAVLYAMADTGMGAAVSAGLDDDQQCATIEVKISYFEPVESGWVTCETSVLREGGSVVYLVSELSQAEEGDSQAEETDSQAEETVAHATGSYAVFTP
jgi:acyl-CoA thioesterase